MKKGSTTNPINPDHRDRQRAAAAAAGAGGDCAGAGETQQIHTSQKKGTPPITRRREFIGAAAVAGAGLMLASGTKVFGQTVGVGNVVYASKAGAQRSPGFSPGPDATAALQAILDRAAPDGVELVIDGVFSIRGLSIKSSTTIRGLGWNTGFFVLPGSGNSAPYYPLTNANHRSSYRGPTSMPDFTFSNVVDQAIAIRDLRIDANRRGGASGHGSYPVLNASGRLISSITLYGVRNCFVDNVYVYDPCTYGVSPANACNCTFTNIRVTCPSALNYNNALQMEGPCSDIYISNLTGFTGDDFLALNAADGNISPTETIWPPSGPQAFGSFSECYYGPITRVVANGIFPDACGSAVRLLSGKDHRPGAVGPVALIDQIDISNVVGSTSWHAFLANTFGDVGAGLHGKIILRNWQVDMIGQASTNKGYNDGYCVIGGTHRSLQLINHNRGTMAADVSSSVVFDGDAVVGEVLIDGMTINETAVVNSTDAITLRAGASVRLLRAVNCSWYRQGTPGNAFLAVADGTIFDAELRNIHLDGVASAVDYRGGALTNLSMVGIVHRHAGGQPTVHIGKGKTLARLRAAGNDSVLLTGGPGTIASKKTDSTEDS